jgi:hypothetical protein
VSAGAEVCFGPGPLGGAEGGAASGTSGSALNSTVLTLRSPSKDTIIELAEGLCFGEQTAIGPGVSAYTSRTAFLTKRSAVRSRNHLVTKRA